MHRRLGTRDGVHGHVGAIHDSCTSLSTVIAMETHCFLATQGDLSSRWDVDWRNSGHNRQCSVFECLCTLGMVFSTRIPCFLLFVSVPDWLFRPAPTVWRLSSKFSSSILLIFPY